MLGSFSSHTWSIINWRYCMRCKSIRPPRSHHCSMCNRCILRMDHHCPWVGNCVGLHNHKYFLMFLFHAMVGCMIVAGVLSHPYWNMITDSKHFLNKVDTHSMATIMVSGALILSLGGLFGFHSYLIATNQSTLEIASFDDGNPFSHQRKVLKSQADRRTREPIKISIFG